MAESLGIAAGIIAVITATIQSSEAVYRTIESFRNYPQRVQELLKQLLSLTEILASLRELSEQDESVGAPLEVPLKECTATCKRFKEVLELHRTRLSNGRNVYAWISFKFRNGDIVNFTETLAVYRSTVVLAIAEANLRTSKITLRTLNEYKRGVDATTEYLQQHCEDVLARLDGLQAPTASEQQKTDGSSAYLEQLREDNSREYCLHACRRLQATIEQMLIQITEGGQPPSSAIRPGSTISIKDMTLAIMTASSGLKACDLEMAHTINMLSKQATTVQRRLLDEPSYPRQEQGELQYGDYIGGGNEEQKDKQGAETQELECELASVKQLLHFCKDVSSRATPDRFHVVENISTGDDSQQIGASTVGDLLRVKGAHVGDRSFQFFGSLAPEHLYEITMLHAKERHAPGPDEAEDSEPDEELHSPIYAGSASRSI